MSSDAAEGTGTEAIPAWERLELNVRRLLQDHEALRRRLRKAERQVEELEKTLERVSIGKLDPVALAEQARGLERENRDLQERLAKARASVDRMVSRLGFLEAER